MALMKHVAQFVVDDTLQYSRQSFQNRTKVRNPTGWQWLSIPLQGKQIGYRICDVRIDSSAPWAGKHKRALEYNYRTTPYFEFYEDQFRQFYKNRWVYLGDVTWNSIQLVHNCLGFTGRLIRLSEHGGEVGATDVLDRKTDFEPVITSEMIPWRYAYNPYEIKVLAYEEPAYRQNFEGFFPGMSILDLLFNYGPEAISLF
jgi:hypothetical protein